MLNQWIVPIQEKVLGRKGRTLLGASIDRAIRNFENGKTREPRLTPGDIFTSMIANNPNIQGQLSRELFDRHLASDGLLSVFFSWHASYIANRAPLVEFATEIDRLSGDLLCARHEDDLERARQILSTHPRLTDMYWDWPGSEGMRNRLTTAKDWDDLTPIIRGISWTVMLSTFALWDVCLHANSFKQLKAEPVFLFLAPRKKPELRGGEKSVEGGFVTKILRRFRGARDILDTPLSLYFELVWWICQCKILVDPSKFPQDRPKLSEIAEFFGNQTPKVMDNFRTGKKAVTLDQMTGMLRPNPPDGSNQAIGFRYQEFIDMLFAAHAWNTSLIKWPGKMDFNPGRAWRFPIFCDVDETYRALWQSHREDGLKRGYAAEGTNIPWADFLRR